MDNLEMLCEAMSQAPVPDALSPENITSLLSSKSSDNNKEKIEPYDFLLSFKSKGGGYDDFVKAVEDQGLLPEETEYLRENNRLSASELCSFLEGTGLDSDDYARMLSGEPQNTIIIETPPRQKYWGINLAYKIVASAAAVAMLGVSLLSYFTGYFYNGIPATGIVGTGSADTDGIAVNSELVERAKNQQQVENVLTESIDDENFTADMDDFETAAVEAVESDKIDAEIGKDSLNGSRYEMDIKSDSHNTAMANGFLVFGDPTSSLVCYSKSDGESISAVTALEPPVAEENTTYFFKGVYAYEKSFAVVFTKLYYGGTTFNEQINSSYAEAGTYVRFYDAAGTTPELKFDLLQNGRLFDIRLINESLVIAENQDLNGKTNPDDESTLTPKYYVDGEEHSVSADNIVIPTENTDFTYTVLYSADISAKSPSISVLAYLSASDSCYIGETHAYSWVSYGENTKTKITAFSLAEGNIRYVGAKYINGFVADGGIEQSGDSVSIVWYEPLNGYITSFERLPADFSDMGTQVSVQSESSPLSVAFSDGNAYAKGVPSGFFKLSADYGEFSEDGDDVRLYSRKWADEMFFYLDSEDYGDYSSLRLVMLSENSGGTAAEIASCVPVESGESFSEAEYKQSLQLLLPEKGFIIIPYTVSGDLVNTQTIGIFSFDSQNGFVMQKSISSTSGASFLGFAENDGLIYACYSDRVHAISLESGAPKLVSTAYAA